MRGAEQAAVRRGAVVSSGLSAALGAAPTVVFAVTLLVYASLGNALTPSTVFASLTLFNQLRFPLLFLPVVLTQLVDAKVALFRISGFLANEEVVPYVNTGTGEGGAVVGSGAATADDTGATISQKTNPSSSSFSSSAPSVDADPLPRGHVRLGPGAFYWSDPKSSLPSLSSTTASTTAAKTAATAAKTGPVKGGAASAPATAATAGGGATVAAPPPPSPALLVEQELTFAPGQLVCVVGPVGVGKSALLQALVGAMHATSATITPSQSSTSLPSEASKKMQKGSKEDASASTDPITAAARFFSAYQSSSSPSLSSTSVESAAPAPAAVVGSVAYCAQSAWLPSTTVKGAIVFGRNATTGQEPSDDDVFTDGIADGSAGASSSSWYSQVLEACQLMTDLDSLPGGDAAEV